jgi:hypothetical protein
MVGWRSKRALLFTWMAGFGGGGNMSEIVPFFARPEMMALLGLLSHGLKKIMRRRRDGDRLTPWGYIARYPYQILAALIGMIAALVALQEMGQLNAVSAFSAGYMANSVADMLGKRGAKTISDE